MARARIGNLALRAARSDTGLARAQLIGSRLRPNPTLAMDYQTTGDRSAGSLEGQSTISVTQDLQLWGVRSARITSATLERDRVSFVVQDAERLIANQVAASYREILFQQQRLGLLDSLVRLNARVARVADLAFRQGLGSELDVRLSAGAAAQAQLDRDRAAREASVQQLELATLLGDSVTARYELTDSLTPAGVRFLFVHDGTERAGSERFDLSTEAVDSLVRLALAARPDVRAAELAVRADAATAAAARGLGRPSLAVGGLVTHSRDNFSLGTQTGSDVATAVGLGVVIGLPLGNRNQGEIARADFAVATAQIQISATRQRAERDVRVAAARVALAASQVETLRRDILPANTAALRLVESAFERGQSNIFQVLQVQRGYVESTTGLLAALREYVAAITDLETAIGQPLPQ
jgi:cobalt-zinc-cadmium efflux system outer membrane protein